ncbi:MAG: glycosyltransferase family 2 protein [Casimicrobiaceae bacterium]
MSAAAEPVDGAPSAGAAQVVIVIPAFNEEGAVHATVSAVRGALGDAGITHDIVVVDDGSTDGTRAEAQRSGARIIAFDANAGYGHALKAGIAASDAALIGILDADGTYPPDALPAMIALAARADMVVGDRGRGMNNVPLIRRPAKWILKLLASVLARRRIDDVNSGLRIFHRHAVERFVPLLPDGYSFTTTITLCMLASDLAVAYHPIHYGRRIGHSKIRARHFFKFVFLVLRLTLIFQPLRIFLPLASGLLAAGIAHALYRDAVLDPPPIALFAIAAGMAVASIGLWADRHARLHAPGRTGSGDP